MGRFDDLSAVIAETTAIRGERKMAKTVGNTPFLSRDDVGQLLSLAQQSADMGTTAEQSEGPAGEVAKRFMQELVRRLPRGIDEWGLAQRAGELNRYYTIHFSEGLTPENVTKLMELIS